MCTCSAIEMPLERAAHLRSRAVEEDALVALGDLEHVADLVRAATVDVAHRDDDALRTRQMLDRGDYDPQRLAIAQRVFGQALPVAGVRAPMPREGIVSRAETLGIDRRFVTFRGER